MKSSPPPARCRPAKVRAGLGPTTAKAPVGPRTEWMDWAPPTAATLSNVRGREAEHRRGNVTLWNFQVVGFEVLSRGLSKNLPAQELGDTLLIFPM